MYSFFITVVNGRYERDEEKRSSLTEDRFIGLGEINGAVIIMTSYAERGRTRIISARFATPVEKEFYYDTRQNP